MAQRLRSAVRMQLVSNGTTALWVDTDKFQSTVGVTRLRGRLVLCEKSGTFQVQVGNQAVSNDNELPDTPVTPTTGTGVGAYFANVGKNFVDYDPTVAGNGSIGGKFSYRNGLWYRSSDATVQRGEVILELYEVD